MKAKRFKSTRKGRDLALSLLGGRWVSTGQEEHSDYGVRELVDVCSRLHTKASQIRRIEECLCGDGVHDGEWVNANYDKLNTKLERLYNETQLMVDAELRPFKSAETTDITVRLGGDPRGALVLLVFFKLGNIAPDGTPIFRHWQIAVN